MRKLNLLIHILSSAGWWGAVASFLVLTFAEDAGQGGAAMAAGMRLLAWWVIVPLCLVSDLTGVIQSLSGAWGLTRHYWVLFKIILTGPCTFLLLLHMQVVDQLVAMNGQSEALRTQLIIYAALALAVLTVITVLSVYKPRGTTPWNIRR